MSYTVDDMCKAGCTTRRGVRYWEDQGLLGKVERTGGNQRRFTDDQMNRARIIAAAQFGGWTLDDIKKMVENFDAEVHEAILVRLQNQQKAAGMLAESLPDVGPGMQSGYDL